VERSYGYAGSILQVNLSTGKIIREPIFNYTDLFLGGRGIAGKIYWDHMSPQNDAFDPENRLIFITGPVTGVTGFAGSRWQVCGKSPIHNRFSYSNLGGSWGAQLKFAGYDGLVVHGKADGWVYLIINNGNAEIREAGHLTGKGAIECRESLKAELGRSFRVAAIGPGGENRVNFATLLADRDSSGSSGLAAVMGSKNLKAIAVRGKEKISVADPEKIRELKARTRPILGELNMSLLTEAPKEKLTGDICYGCKEGCNRRTYHGENGKKGKFFCHSAIFYESRAHGYYGEFNDVPFQANKLCDDYGLDTYSVDTLIMWLSRCYKAGILTDEKAGLPLSKIGSLEFIESITKKIAFRDGFGDILADGVHKAAEYLGVDAQRLITDYVTETGSLNIYGPRTYITTGLLYAMEPRQPIQQLHEISVLLTKWAGQRGDQGHNNLTTDVLRAIARRFWGSELAADFSTYDGKALAAIKIQDRQYAKESLILCDFAWPVTYVEQSNDHVGDPTLESQLCWAVTGREMNEQDLYRIGERNFNLQRAILAREGHRGRKHDVIQEFNFTVPLKGEQGNPNCLVPGKDGETISRKGMVVDRDQFEKMKSEYYRIRDWDVVTGLQKKAQMEALGMRDVAAVLEREGLLV